MTPDVRSHQNSLLAALPRDEWSNWVCAIEPVEMPLGSVLYESGMQMKHVYFPVTSIVSLLHVLADGATAEIAVVGNDSSKTLLRAQRRCCTCS